MGSCIEVSKTVKLSNCQTPSSKPRHQGQAQQQTAQAKKPQLPVTELQDLQKGLAPGGGRQKRHGTFYHQQQRDGQPEGAAVQANVHFYFLTLAGAAGADPRIVLKKSELAGSSTMTSLFLEKVAL